MQKLPVLRTLLQWVSDPASLVYGRGVDRSRIRRDFLLNFLLGSTLALAIHLAPKSGWVVTQQEQATDWMLRINQGIDPESYRGVPLVLLEIGEATHRTWGEPLHVPRERLAALIRFAVGGGARSVVVDVDLSRPAGQGDRELEAVLRSAGEQGGPGAADIVLARGLREPWPRAEGAWLEERASFLDELVAASPRLHWASPLFVRERDLRIRRFRSFEPTCTDGVPGVLPSIQVLVAVQVLDPMDGTRRLNEALRHERPGCGGASVPPATTSPSLRFGDLVIDLRGDGLANLILYAFGWSESGPTASPRVGFRERQVPLFTAVPAELVESGQPLDPSLVEGRIVIIGASHADARDLHHTPLGELPGPVILANATYSLLQYGNLRPPPTRLLLGAQLVLIAVVSLVFARIASVWATLAAAPLVIIMLLPLSFLLFRQGVWLDFAIPVFAVQLQAAVKKYSDQLSTLRERLRNLRGRIGSGPDSGDGDESEESNESNESNEPGRASKPEGDA